MTENDIHKSADQILEELFSTLGEPATAIASDPSSVPKSNEIPVIEIDNAVAVDAKPEIEVKSSEKKKKKKKEKKKSKKKKRKKGDGSDDDKRSHGKEKKKKKDDNPLAKVSSREPKPKVDAEVKGIEEVTKQHESKKDAKKQVKPKAVKEEVKKDAKSEAKPHAKDEAKKESKSDVKVSVKSDRSHTEDRRKRTTVEPRESRRSYPAPKRRKSRSRSPVARRTQSRRSRSRSPPRRVRRPRSRSRSRSPYHRKRSRSPIVLKRPLTPPKSPKIDKAQLLEFARQNLKRMQETGSLPAGVTLPNQPPVEVPPATTQFTGKTVAELTDYCKNLMADPSGEDDDTSTKKDSETTFTRHPFQIKPRSDTIVMNIRNAVALPVRKPEERVVAQAQLKQQFPVSSGQQHLELEWVPVTPAPVVKEPVNSSKGPKTNTATVTPTPRVPLPPAEPPSADIGSIVAKRISSIRKLQENQFDVQARLELEEAESMTQSWATYHHTNPMTGEPMPELIDWSGAPQAWVRKDQFSSAAPVAGGVGMKLLQKMGWQPGEGLGRNKEGTLEPLSLDIKMDKKGLLCKEELAPVRPTPAVKLIQDFQGKHPVSILHELCTKKHWEPPVFEQVADIGPDHLKHFLFKVAVNGVEYQSCLASTTKKEAKAQSAAACLQALDVFAPPS